MRALAALALAVAPLIAAAECGCPKLPGKILFGKAEQVFHALLVGTELDRSPPAGLYRDARAVVRGRYELLEVFKGAPDPGGTVIDRVAEPGACALGLATGRAYLFYVDQRGRVGICEGSRPYPGGPDLHTLRKLSSDL